MRCMLFKIAASFAKSLFRFHIKDRLFSLPCYALLEQTAFCSEH